MAIERSLPNRIRRLEVQAEQLRHDIARTLAHCDEPRTHGNLAVALFDMELLAGCLADALGHATVAARDVQPQPHPLADALAARSA